MLDAKEGQTNFAINVISIVVPILVAIILSIPYRIDLGEWTKVLPHVIGIVNTLTSVALVIGFILVRRKNVEGHRIAMGTAFLLGGIFLICYLTYHISNPANEYPGTGTMRIIYLVILLSHILLSIVVLPLVLRAIAYAIKGDFYRHRRIAMYAFPVWLYVSVSGVVVYFMLYHLF